MPTERELETEARIEFEANVGQIIKVRRVMGYRPSSDSDEVALDPPLAVRVLAPTCPEDLTRWMDGGWLDPVWNVEAVTKDPRLDGLRSLWIHATSYNLDGQTEDPDYV